MIIRQAAHKLQAWKLLLPQQILKSEGPLRGIAGISQVFVFSPSLLKSRRFSEQLLPSCRFPHLEKALSSCAQQATEQSGIIEVPLAQTGEGIADCELLSWLVKEGDEIDEFQPLCSVQSDKATIQITSRYKGKVSRLNFLPGDVIKVGESLLELLSSSVRSPPSDCDDSSGSNLPVKNDSDSLEDKSSRRVLATPAVRQLARSHGMKLEDIPGSGKDGRVLKEDLLQFLDAKEGLNEEMASITNIAPKDDLISPPSYEHELFSENGKDGAQTSIHFHEQSSEHGKDGVQTSISLHGAEEDTTIPVRGYQRTMVKAMTAAATIPHFYLVDEVKLDALINLRNNVQDSYAEQGVKLTYLPFMMKALSVALLKYPLMNSTYEKEASTICCRGNHNVGVAIATPHGLAVPNVKNVQRLSIIEIAGELARLTQLASENKLSAEDVAGGTISVSNFGSIGGKLGYPLLNLPEVAIGAFGQKQKVPRFADDGSIYPAAVMNVTWAADHRVLDGATLTKFSNEWKSLIEQPARLVVQLK